ncbi:hypothetical protein EMIHUDRAFT_55989, partial [Emiliania huxleyi CCMP1516]|uniref:UBC core domain-containing protein n=2 Tax=Emiliania huxleyi TaxID=2903 RepID=A0A0D3JSJ8_EMIH1
VFVRHDEARLDTWRLVLSGPVDTPYAHGLFVFDVYAPPEYPSIPPLVHFETTGGGTVKFNPNLYADGKAAALARSHTRAAANATEKWDPAVSTLFQVAVSIQSQILVPHPCQNEPGYEGVAPDSAESREYNAKLRLYTMRHAMLGALRSPPAGFEDVAAAHFASLRDRILDTCRGW